jgi:spore coat protein H
MWRNRATLRELGVRPIPLTPVIVFGVLSLSACEPETSPSPEAADTNAIESPDTIDMSDTTDSPETIDALDIPNTSADSTTTQSPIIHRLELELDPTAWQRLEDHPDATDELDCTLTFDGTRIEGVDFELHGGFARAVPKKSYRLELPDEAEIPLALFGPPELHRRFVLKASYIDPTFLRERLTLDLVREEGGLAPRVAFTELTINGEWRGLYLLVERVDRPFIRRHGLGDTMVQLYKAEDHNANWQAKPDPLAGYDIELGAPALATDLGDLLNALTRTPLSVDDFEREVEPRLSLDDFLIWQRVHTFAGNRDTFTKNYYLAHDLEHPSPFRIVSWDADATFGLDWDGTPLPADERAWHGTDRFSPRLFQIPVWRGLHALAYREALEIRWTPDRLEARIRELASLLRPVAERDLELWQSRISYLSEIERLIASIRNRHRVMTGVLDGL